MTIRNNVTRFLEQQRVAFTAHELPDEKIGAFQAAEILGVPAEQMYKSIVILRPGRGRPVLALVNAVSEVDLKSLAAAVGEKKLNSATQSDAEARTGLKVGGISPLALVNKDFQVVVDTSALSQPQIFVSGGQRGLIIQLAPRDLMRLCHATASHIARPHPPG